MRLPWLADVLRAAGLTVFETPGWQARGRDLTHVRGVVCHHTHASLPGPLSQLGLDRGGRFWIIAGGKANHNGYGRWGNSSIGIEAFNDGVGGRPVTSSSSRGAVEIQV